MKPNPTSLRQRMIAMEKDTEMTVPVNAYGMTTVKTYASEIGFALERKYTTTKDRATRTYIIRRIA